MKAPIVRLAKSSAMHALGAFIFMGSWAFFANSAHAMPEPFVAGLIQGGLSTCITLLLKKGTEYLVARLSGVYALIFPPLAASATSFCLLTSIHSLAGTPEVLWTIVLPFSVASLYAASYTYSLWILKRAADERS